MLAGVVRRAPVKIRRGSRSSDVIDQRGAASPGLRLPGGLGAAGGGIGGIIVLIVVYFLTQGGGGGGLGIDNALQNLPGAVPAQPGVTGPDPDADLVEFVSFVLDDVQNSWVEHFEASGVEYERAQLVLFTDAVQSGCGNASSATGPFYCTLDHRVYLDLGFFDELQQRFGAPGDFAQAYVIAHEVAHHVQNQLGVTEQVNQRVQEDPSERNELSIRMELQADCLAGVWGYTARDRGILEAGDLQEGLAAASAVGDDRIQQQAGGAVNPEQWTHGSSEQRVEWFTRGFESGEPAQCNPFDGDI